MFLPFSQLSFAQKDDKKDDVYEDSKYNIKLEYHNDWKVKEKIKSTINLENSELLNKNVNDLVYSDFNHFRLLHIISDVEKNGAESILLGDTIIPITLYHNMSSLEDTRVYPYMSSLEQDRVYQNMLALKIPEFILICLV